MKIGFVGTGTVGSALIRVYTRLGHEVKITNEIGPQVVKNLIDETKAKFVSLEEAVKDVDVVFVCIPMVAIPSLPKQVFKDIPQETVIVETANYFPHRDGKIQEIEDGKVEAIWVSEQLGRKTVKAFTNIVSSHMNTKGQPKGSPDRIALTVSGDDERSKKIVSKLIEDAGFDAYDAGTLAESWRQQPGSPAYCTELSIVELPKALSRAKRDQLAWMRDKSLESYFENPKITGEEIVSQYRVLFNSKN